MFGLFKPKSYFLKAIILIKRFHCPPTRWRKYLAAYYLLWWDLKVSRSMKAVEPGKKGEVIVEIYPGF